MKGPCRKQVVRCVIQRATGERYAATNECDVDGDVCPRIAAGYPSGEGYGMCQSVHAEIRAAELAAETSHVEGVAYIGGHTWICKNCQDALRAINVNTFVILGMEED
jgi:hypothetical protein